MKEDEGTCFFGDNNVVQFGVEQEKTKKHVVFETDESGKEDGPASVKRQDRVDSDDVEENKGTVFDGRQMPALGAQQWYDVVECDEHVDAQAYQKRMILEFNLVAYKIEHEHYRKDANKNERDRFQEQLLLILK